MSESSDCVFCKIIKSELPCKKVYEDEHTLAFLNIKPDTPDHTLVIPKQHYKNLIDCPPKVLNNVMAAVQKLTKRYLEKGYKTVKIVMNNEPPCQEVFHLHFHVIPYTLQHYNMRWVMAQQPV